MLAAAASGYFKNQHHGKNWNRGLSPIKEFLDFPSALELSKDLVTNFPQCNEDLAHYVWGNKPEVESNPAVVLLETSIQFVCLESIASSMTN